VSLAQTTQPLGVPAENLEEETTMTTITTQGQALRIASMNRPTLDAGDATGMRAVSVLISSLPVESQKLAVNISRDPRLNDFVWGRGLRALEENHRLEQELSALEVANYLRSLHGQTPLVQKARKQGQELLRLVLSMRGIPL